MCYFISTDRLTCGSESMIGGMKQLLFKIWIPMGGAAPSVAVRVSSRTFSRVSELFLEMVRPSRMPSKIWCTVSTVDFVVFKADSSANNLERASGARFSNPAKMPSKSTPELLTASS